jgi:tetratricopeptide (TPR) repeat protein
MPESTCLHIQDHESAPIRVVDVPWISVRVGRAAFCEVRLAANDLADEACRLYRRGRLWHLVPVGGDPKSEILLEGRRVDASCLLPFNVPFRIGEFCLTLRQDRTVDPDWGLYPGTVPDRPKKSTVVFERGPFGRDRTEPADLVVEPQAIVEPPFKPEWRPQGMPTVSAPGADYSAGASVKDRWETRWRVAGAELKARSQRPSSSHEPRRPRVQAGFDSVPVKAPRAPRPMPTAPPQPEPPARPTSKTSAPVEVVPSEPVPVADPSEFEFFAHHLSAEVNDGPNTVVTDQPSVGAMIETSAPEPSFADLPPENLVSLDDEPRPKTDDESWYEMPILVLPPETKSGESTPETTTRPARSSRQRANKTSLKTESDRPRLSSSRSRKNSEPKNEPSVRAPIDREPHSNSANRAEPAPDVKAAQWPSAKDIMASHRTRAKPPVASVAAGRPMPETGLTVPREPAHWTVPVWLLGPPVAVFVLAIGLGGGVLSWRWATDAYAVSIMTGRLMSADGRAPRSALAVSVEPPDGTWTNSTAQHLAHWAIFMCRNETGQQPPLREASALLNKALQISPLNPTARLAIAQFEMAEAGEPISQRALGLSRDALSLSLCARRLLVAGDKENALKIFGKALGIAAGTQGPRAGVPRFSDDAGVSRYLLPGEERVQNVVREMVSKNEWTFDELSAALPRNPATFVAAARVLKKLGRAEAERLVDVVLDDRGPLEDAQGPDALGLAARAEAFALKSRWRESEEQYRLAIERSDDDTIKRSWWFNLADIEHQLHDESQRQVALRAALADAGDDISQRATDMQRGNVARQRSPLSSPKAN